MIVEILPAHSMPSAVPTYYSGSFLSVAIDNVMNF